ncbi:hypothetical protein [Bacillus sp. FSL K6-3431]|uniref:hypothetical protein n=1 Tax=Bacillus sp. FSL K6-3431 TaxID=2921500 RepID=UPI0030FAEFFC
MNVILQYNGIILLNSYLQRLFVFEKINSMLENSNEHIQINTISPLLDTIEEIGNEFNRTKQLSQEDKEKAHLIIGETRKLMKTYLHNISTYTNFEEKIAIAASTIYGEEHINNGVIKLGELFNSEILDRYMQQKPYHQKRVALINHIVHKKVIDNLLTDDEMIQIEKWYDDVIQNKNGIESDLDTINRFIDGKE